MLISIMTSPLLMRENLIKLYQLVSGRRFLKIYNELKRTEFLDRDSLLSLRRAKLYKLISYAYQYVPYYRRTFDEAGFLPEDLNKDFSDFRKIPLLTKKDIIDHREEFFTTDLKVRKTLLPTSSSGTSGMPLSFWQDRNHWDHYKADYWRSQSYSGWQLGDRTAYLWGIMDANKNQSLYARLRESMKKIADNSFKYSALDLSDEKYAELALRISQERPVLLTGYASALYAFAQYLRRKNLTDLKLRSVYSSAEMLYPHQREFIEKTLNCRIFNRYVSRELGIIAYECEMHNGMHVSMENCYAEVIGSDKTQDGGNAGEIVLTDLNNFGFPFIRYCQGDMVQMKEQVCECGRQGTVIESIKGRTSDLFIRSDGGVVYGAFDVIPKKVSGIKQYQIIQKEVDLIIVRLVCDNKFDLKDKERITRIIRKIMGEATKVRFEFHDKLTLSLSGKFRYCYSELAETRQNEKE